MRNRSSLVAFFLLGSCLLFSACQPAETEQGAAAVQLHFLDDGGNDLRGVLSGVVETIEVRVLEGTEVIAESSFDYEGLGGTLEDIPAG